MTHDTTLAAVLVLVAALVVAPVAAAAPSGGPAAAYGAQDHQTPTPEADENASVQPGERLSGVVNVQQAEFEGEVDERTFGVKVAQANTDAAKAQVVSEQLGDVEQRIDALENRQERLNAARENGSISEGTYRAEMSEVAAELETAKRLANASEETAGDLPADVLSEEGIDVTAIQTLKVRAENLSGPEVAEIARSVAGRDVGQSMAGAKKPGEVGSQIPDDAGNRTDGADRDQQSGQNGADGQQDTRDGADGQQDDQTDAAAAIDRADQAVSSASERVRRAEETVTDGSSDEAQAALERARENLTAAEQALGDAREASENGDDQRAAELADEALEHAQASLDHAQDALDGVDGGAGQGSGSGQGA